MVIWMLDSEYEQLVYSRWQLPRLLTINLHANLIESNDRYTDYLLPSLGVL